MIKLKRIYEKPEVTDGLRILVDRLWPRGVRRSTANVDIWLRDVGPTDELRKWFAHDPKKWVRFKQKYVKELKENPAFEDLVELGRTNDPLTLLYSTRDTKHNQALVVQSMLVRELKKPARVK